MQHFYKRHLDLILTNLLFLKNTKKNLVQLNMQIADKLDMHFRILNELQLYIELFTCTLTSEKIRRFCINKKFS